MKAINQFRKENKKQNKAFYNVRSLLGNTWAMFYIICGPRQCGKTYSLMESYIRQFKTHGRVFY